MPSDQLPATTKGLSPRIFAVLCLVLASVDLLDKDHPVHPIVIGLIALATAPWSLPWFAGLVQTFKVGSVELNFRAEVQQKIEEQQKKIDDQDRTVAAVAELGVGRCKMAIRRNSPVGCCAKRMSSLTGHLPSICCAAIFASCRHPPGQEWQRITSITSWL